MFKNMYYAKNASLILKQILQKCEINEENLAEFSFILKIGEHGDTAREHFEMRFFSCNIYRHTI